MATLYDLAMQYLNQSLPKTFKYDRTNPPTIGPRLPVQPEEPIKKLLPVQGGGGGDGFSVYNPDPNSIANKNYSPYAYRQAMAKSGVGIPSSILSDSEFLYGKKSPLDGVMSILPGQQILKGLASKLPVNKRAILENELSGQGIMVNDIGQIVQGEGAYNTAENIMAGYNASKIDADTIQDRRDTINESLGKFDKYDPSSPKFDVDKYNQMKDKLSALDEFAKIRNIAIDNTETIFDKESLDKDPGYKSLDEKIKEGLLEGDDDDDEFDPTSLDYTNPNIYNTDSIYTSTAPTYTDTTVTSDDGYIDPNPGTDNKGFDPGVTPGESGFIGLDEDMDVNPFDYNDYGTYDGPSTGGNITGGTNLNDYDDDYSDDSYMAGDDSKASPTGSIFDSPVTGTTKPGESGGTDSPGGGGTHCCTAANERGDMTLLEVKKLRVWHRKQSKIWQRGYDVWGRVMADNLVSKYKWSSDRVRDFYNHKIYGKRTIGSTFADFCIYPMSMIIGSILTVMPPILGYQENKRHGKSSS